MCGGKHYYHVSKYGAGQRLVTSVDSHTRLGLVAQLKKRRTRVGLESDSKKLDCDGHELAK